MCEYPLNYGRLNGSYVTSQKTVCATVFKIVVVHVICNMMVICCNITECNITRKLIDTLIWIKCKTDPVNQLAKKCKIFVIKQLTVSFFCHQKSETTRNT